MAISRVDECMYVCLPLLIYIDSFLFLNQICINIHEVCLNESLIDVKQICSAIYEDYFILLMIMFVVYLSWMKCFMKTT